MSSPGSPTINLDVRARRAERVIVGSALAATLFGLSFSNESIVSVAFAAACLLTSVLGLFYTVGWLGGPRRLTRIVWRAEGGWLLCDASGMTHECELSGASRATPYATWLCWVGHRTRPLLLVSGDVPDADFRRLVVRLRLDTHGRRQESLDVS